MADPNSLTNFSQNIISHDSGLFNLVVALAGKSPETQRKYIEWIRNFHEDVIGTDLNDPTRIPIPPFLSAITPATVEAWLGQYAAQGHSRSGLGQARAAVVFVTRMLVLSKQAPSSMWHDLKLVSLPDNAATAAYGESVGRNGPRWLSPEEVRALMNSIKTQKNQHRAKRDAVLVWLMVTLGLRRDELANLEWENLTRRGGKWVIRIRGKRNKWRAVDVPKETILVMQPWANAITDGTQGLPPGRVLRRVHRTGKISKSGITGNAIWRIVTDAWARSKMLGDLAPHDLRRTAAAIALEAGANEREIQQMLGHSSIETTHRYLAPLRENTATYRIAELLTQDNFFADL